jgi:hypothetical protein
MISIKELDASIVPPKNAASSPIGLNVSLCTVEQQIVRINRKKLGNEPSCLVQMTCMYTLDKALQCSSISYASVCAVDALNVKVFPRGR